MRRHPAPPTDQPISPRQLYDEAVASKDNFSRKACLRSLASRRVILSGRTTAPNPEIPSTFESHVSRPPGFLSRWLRSSSKRASENSPVHSTPGHSAPVANEDQISYAVAAVTRAEPCRWEGKKAHFVWLHVEFHPDATHYLERVDFTIRVWKAGDALKSIKSISHTKLLTLEPPDAPEYGNDAPPIVLYSPRAVVGRSTGSTAEPYWEGHFQPGEHFVYFAEAMPPVDLISAGPNASTQPRSLLHISAFGDDKEWRPAPNFDVGLVVLSEGKSFELTASSSSLHWGIPAVQRYLFTPYKPARFTRTTRLIPKGEKRIGKDLGEVALKETLKKMMGWASMYDTVRVFSSPRPGGSDDQIWFGCPDGCVDKPVTPGRHCSSEFCKTCQESRRVYEERCDAEASASPTS